MRAGILLAFLLLSCVVFSQEISIKNSPELDVHADRELYGAGENGTLFIEINTYGILEDVDIETVVVSPEGIITGGAIVLTDLPEKTVLKENLVQMEQIVAKSKSEHLYGDRTLKLVDFQIPDAAPSGTYTINTRLYASGHIYEKSSTIQVVGQGAVNSIVLIYIVVIIIFGYVMLRR